MNRPGPWPIAVLSGVFGRPRSGPRDYLLTIAAEDQFDFQSRLSEIRAPTVEIGGRHNPLYSPDLFRETEPGIGNARLILCEEAGHTPTGRHVTRDTQTFLEENRH
jgi:hypothetical protein